jgi:CDP-glucose 4,6-dehydratase
MFQGVFSGATVLVTGHTGFKGSWLTYVLLSLGAKVSGYSLDPLPHEVLFEQLGLSSRLESDFRGDIRDIDQLRKEVDRINPDFVFHLAAQPLVRLSYAKPRETFETNVLGTVNILESLLECKKRCAVVVVTTDKCYENKEWVHSYREEDPLGGYDPYSASKGCAEIVASAYRSSFFSKEGATVSLATARAGNVIGGGDWAIDRIVPDVMRCVFRGDSVSVRNKRSTRPWQHVLEPLSGYLWLAAHLKEPYLSDYPDASLSSAFNFGPPLESNRTVLELVECLLKYTGGSWIDVSNNMEPHEASKLNLSIDKAFHLLGWRPNWSFENSIRQTALWYTSVHQGMDPVEATELCIGQYLQDAIQNAQRWASTKSLSL